MHLVTGIALRGRQAELARFRSEGESLESQNSELRSQYCVAETTKSVTNKARAACVPHSMVRACVPYGSLAGQPEQQALALSLLSCSSRR